MPYRFKPSDASVKKAVRRIALEQIDRAVAEIADPALTADAKIHQVRKRLKKLRGLIRLMRPAFPAHDEENAAFRDAARLLSPLRESDVLTATYDSLCDANAAAIDRPALAPVRRSLTLAGRHEAEVESVEAALGDVAARLAEARQRAERWRLSRKGFKALEGGLKKTFGRARKAMERARETGAPQDFHDWRKRVKYHTYHARLLNPVWPELVDVHAVAGKRLGDLIGEHHDIHVFIATLERNDHGPAQSRDVLCALARERSAILEADALALGARLFAERPKTLAGRWGALWRVWRRARKEALAARATTPRPDTGWPDTGERDPPGWFSTGRAEEEGS